MYTVTRDGFTLLVMGFTGEKAMKFKLAYIEEFNRMEGIIREARAGMLSVGEAMEKFEPMIRANERMRCQLGFASHFLPSGVPGEPNRQGNPKNRFRRGYYVSRNGRSIQALIESPDLPGIFEEIELITVN